MRTRPTFCVGFEAAYDFAYCRAPWSPGGGVLPPTAVCAASELLMAGFTPGRSAMPTAGAA